MGRAYHVRGQLPTICPAFECHTSRLCLPTESYEFRWRGPSVKQTRDVDWEDVWHDGPLTELDWTKP